MLQSFQKMGQRSWESRRRGMAILSELLRALGLRSFLYLFRGLCHWFPNRHKPEAPKPVLRRSRVYATCRSTVHFTPMAVFTWMLFSNYRVVYYGPGLSVFDRSDALYFALFQIAAKVIELVCLASLCTMLLHVLRDDLLYGDGVSLGLLTSSSWFASPIYLLSPEFVSAVQTSLTLWWRFLRHPANILHLNCEEAAACWRRTRLAILLPVLMLIAALVGPSSAVLLIPRDQMFPAGGTTYFLNATFDEMWPSVVSSDFELEVCSKSNATLYPVCPSGGYSSFRYQGGFNGIYDATFFEPSQTADSRLWFISSLVLDPLDLVPAMLSAGVDRRGQRPWMPTYVTQPNLYSTITQQMIFRDWVSAIRGPSVPAGAWRARNYQYANAVSASAVSTHPTTHVRCSVPQNLSSQADVMGFHFVSSQPLSVNGWSQDNVTRPVNITALRRDLTTHVRSQWVPLPLEDFGPVSTGILFELPWSSSDNGRSRVAISCTVAAAWAQAITARSETSNYFAWAVKSTEPDSDVYIRNITINTTAADVQAPNYNKHIELTREWLDLLTPVAPDPPSTNDSWQPSTLENIFHAAGFDTLMQELRYQDAYIGADGGCRLGTLDPGLTDLELWDQTVCSKEDKISFIERTVARLVTDGLSRRLSYRAFEMLPNIRSWALVGQSRTEDYDVRLINGNHEPSKNAIIMPDDSALISQRLEIAVKGYGHKATETSDYLATLVIAIYLLIATIHVLWILIYKPVTSISWDSAIELLLLAYNSTPEPHLLGTSAKIQRWNTYKRTVKVRAVQLDASESNPAGKDSALHLRLVLEADTMESNTNTKPDPLRQTLLDPRNDIAMSDNSLKPPAVKLNRLSQSSSYSGSQTSAQPQHYVPVEIDKKYY